MTDPHAGCCPSFLASFFSGACLALGVAGIVLAIFWPERWDDDDGGDA